MNNDVTDAIWTNLFQHTPSQWIVQGRLTDGSTALRTAGGVLRLLTVLNRYPHRVLLSSHTTPPALVNDATYPGEALIRAAIPNESNFLQTAWPEPACEDALLIVDHLDPRLWAAFQEWRGQRAALVVLLTNNPRWWISPMEASWVLNVTHFPRPRYVAPKFEEWDRLRAAEEAKATQR